MVPTLRPHKHKWPRAALVPVLLAGALAGCLAQTDDPGSNKAPTAKLTVEPDTGWAGDTFTFDGRDSTDEDGEIERWLFDFGDGTTQVATRSDDARVRHAYARGGQYTVTLTVTDDGGERSGARTDTVSKQVAVNEEMPVQQQVFSTGNNLTQGQGSRSDLPFNVTAGGDRFEVDLDVQSALLVGDSEIVVKVLDPEDRELASETLHIASSQMEHVYLNGTLLREGDYVLRSEARSGAATLTGELRLIYG